MRWTRHINNLQDLVYRKWFLFWMNILYIPLSAIDNFYSRPKMIFHQECICATHFGETIVFWLFAWYLLSLIFEERVLIRLAASWNLILFRGVAWKRLVVLLLMWYQSLMSDLRGKTINRKAIEGDSLMTRRNIIESRSQ